MTYSIENQRFKTKIENLPQSDFLGYLTKKETESREVKRIQILSDYQKTVGIKPKQRPKSKIII